METKPKIIVICGPTSSGKSDAAIRLAKKLNGEIISADSRQIYRGMNIGTGKVTGSAEPFIPDLIRDPEMLKQVQHDIFISEGVLHHLIDIVDPMEDFNVSHFKRTATEAIEAILSRGKLPIICGGTGFWISALTENMTLPEVEPNEELRNKLHNKSTEELFTILTELDPERAKTIDLNNNVRLIRAIEIATTLGKVPKLQVKGEKLQVKKYDFLKIGINVPREILNEKIKKRLEQRFDEGMIEEVKNLHKQGITWEWMEKIGLEYRWITRYLQNKISLEEMKEKLYFDIIHYAKRQMTWLKRDKEIIWLSNNDEIEKQVNNFLAK